MQQWRPSRRSQFHNWRRPPLRKTQALRLTPCLPRSAPLRTLSRSPRWQLCWRFRVTSRSNPRTSRLLLSMRQPLKRRAPSPRLCPSRWPARNRFSPTMSLPLLPSLNQPRPPLRLRRNPLRRPRALNRSSPKMSQLLSRSLSQPWPLPSLVLSPLKRFRATSKSKSNLATSQLLLLNLSRRLSTPSPSKSKTRMRQLLLLSLNPPAKTPPLSLRLFPSGRLRTKSRPSPRMNQLPPSPSQLSRLRSLSQLSRLRSLSQLLRPPSPSQPLRPLSLRLCFPPRLRSTIRPSPQMSRLLRSPNQSLKTSFRPLSLRPKVNQRRQRRYKPRKPHPASLCLLSLPRTTTRPPKSPSRHPQRKRPRLGRLLKLRRLPNLKRLLSLSQKPSQLLKPKQLLKR